MHILTTKTKVVQLYIADENAFLDIRQLKGIFLVIIRFLRSDIYIKIMIRAQIHVEKF